NTFTATDAAGNSSTCSFTVTVNDTQAPSISCPANIVVNNTTGQCGANVTFAATASDNCGTANISYSPASGTFFNVGTTTVTATADDGHGNTTTCTFTVTVNDTQAPAITCAPTLIVNNTPGLCTGTANLTAPIVTDNCAIAPQMLSNGSFGTGSTNWDQCGNNVEAYGTEASYGGSNPFNAVAEIDHEPVTLCQNINGFVVGQTYQLTFRASRRLGAPPTVGTVITIDGGALNTTVSRSNSVFSLTPETISFVATQTTHQLKFEPSAGWGGTVGFIIDDIAISRQSISNNAPPTFPFGDTTVTWTATDAAGNTTTCNQTVTVNDTEAPTIACPGNITVNNTTNQCGANVSFVATASDNCGTANITYSPASGSFFAVGTTTVTATADDGHGNTASCTFTVTVNDTQPPVINCPANFNVDVDAGQCGAVVNFAATASDNCGTANITYSPASGSFFAVGTTTVTATADDGHGNTASCAFTVTVDLLDWANLQWPPNATICPGGSFTAYGQVYEPNITTVSQQQGAGIEVQFGYSTTNSNPSGWSNWMPALFNQFGGNPANDEYYYDFSLTTPGTYYYTFRYRQYGCAWQYGGFNNGGGYFWDGTNNVSGILTVQSLDWANLQWPPNATICQGSSMTAYGQVYEPGVTPGANAQGAGIEVEFGYSTTNTNPSSWSNWAAASFNQFGGGYANDEYYYNFTPPTSGTYFYTFRYRLNGCLWQYGGYSNPGGYFWDGTNHVNGTLNVSPTTVGGTVSGGTSICPGETSALLTLSGHTGSILR
ncbi:MAG: HYR domain-containing protein, partial [Bacteroidia bacterium]